LEGPKRSRRRQQNGSGGWREALKSEDRWIDEVSGTHLLVREAEGSSVAARHNSETQQGKVRYTPTHSGPELER
jgi:hypothetical protein